MQICFYIFPLNYRQIFSTLFLKFPIGLPYIALFIKLWNTSILLLFFTAFILSFMLNSIYGFNHWDC